MLLDPTQEEENEADGAVSVGVMPALGKVTGLWLTGEMDVDEACNVSCTGHSRVRQAQVLTLRR